LDKVCFIGQSGVGKTTLLKFFVSVIKYILAMDMEVDVIRANTNVALSRNHRRFYVGLKDYMSEQEIQKEVQYPKEELLKDEEQTSIFIKYPAEMLLIFNQFDKAQQEGFFNDNIKETLSTRFIDFENHDTYPYWQQILAEVTKHQELEIQERLKLAQLVQKRNITPKEIQEATANFQKWMEETPNPLRELGEKFLDKILNKFNLKIKTELDFQRKEDIGFIKIETLQGEEVPSSVLSTGTKQVVLTGLPIFALRPKESIIFMDEPERSLYPDIQTEVVNLYTSLAPDSQFFFATHSPLIAASFDPWEIVELKFEQSKGVVYQDPYFEGDRHVDNFFNYPKYLRYDSILTQIFDINQDRSPEGQQRMKAISKLDVKLRKKDLSEVEKQQLWEEFQRLVKDTDYYTVTPV
jgi:ABC-type lipoprotein export system ATPase subunit